MVLLLGINFSERQLVRKALTSLYGVSSNSKTRQASVPTTLNALKPSAARHNVLDRLTAQHYIHPTARLGELSDSQLTALTASLSELTIENALRRNLVNNIRRLRDMGSYRGRRHAMGMPVRGQRTRTNAKTAKKLNKVERKG